MACVTVSSGPLKVANDPQHVTAVVENTFEPPDDAHTHELDRTDEEPCMQSMQAHTDKQSKGTQTKRREEKTENRTENTKRRLSHQRGRITRTNARKQTERPTLSWTRVKDQPRGRLEKKTRCMRQQNKRDPASKGPHTTCLAGKRRRWLLVGQTLMTPRNEPTKNEEKEVGKGQLPDNQHCSIRLTKHAVLACSISNSAHRSSSRARRSCATSPPIKSNWSAASKKDICHGCLAF